MSKIENLEAVRNAQEAEQLRNNKTLQQAFAVVEKQYLDAMLTATEKDDLGRFRYSEAIKVVRMVQDQINIAVELGKLAEHDLKQMGGKRRSFF